MNVVKSMILALPVVLLIVWHSQAQQLKLVQAEFGKLLANQTLLIEGRQEPKWYYFLRPGARDFKIIAITDQKGFFQVVDLPAGEYTLKLVRVDEKPLTLGTFKLKSGYVKQELSNSIKLKESLGVEMGKGGKPFLK